METKTTVKPESGERPPLYYIEKIGKDGRLSLIAVCRETGGSVYGRIVASDDSEHSCGLPWACTKESLVKRAAFRVNDRRGARYDFTADPPVDNYLHRLEGWSNCCG